MPKNMPVGREGRGLLFLCWNMGELESLVEMRILEKKDFLQQ